MGYRLLLVITVCLSACVQVPVACEEDNCRQPETAPMAPPPLATLEFSACKQFFANIAAPDEWIQANVPEILEPESGPGATQLWAGACERGTAGQNVSGPVNFALLVVRVHPPASLNGSGGGFNFYAVEAIVGNQSLAGAAKTFHFEARGASSQAQTTEPAPGLFEEAWRLRGDAPFELEFRWTHGDDGGVANNESYRFWQGKGPFAVFDVALGATHAAGTFAMGVSSFRAAGDTAIVGILPGDRQPAQVQGYGPRTITLHQSMGEQS